MIIYLAVFLSSCFCLYLKDRISGWLSLFLTSIGILLPCLLAAVRDESIGTDVTVYGVYIYEDTQNVNLLEAFALLPNDPHGFVALAWLVNLMKGTFPVFLFTIELLVIVPAYLSISYFLKENTWLGMLIFYLLFYVVSLNLMKQMIAVSLTALALRLTLEKRYKSWILCSVIATLIHQTGIVSFLIYPLSLLFVRTVNSSFIRKLLIYLISFFAIVVILIFSDTFLTILSGMRESYSYMSDNTNEGGILITPIIYLGFIISLHYMDSRTLTMQDPIQDLHYSNEEKNNSFIEYLSILGLLLMELQIITLGLARFGYYFEFYLSIYVAYMIKKDNISIKLLSTLFIIFITILQIKFILEGNCQAYPYKSEILGIY